MISDKQLKILAFPYSDYDALICSGAVRSGKTSIMSVAFIDWAMDNFNNRKFGICGKTVSSAIENVVTPWMNMSRTKKKYRVKFNRSLKLLTVIKNGKRNVFEIFGGNDERSQDLIQGRTLAGVLLDEVALMPQSFVNQATARCSVDGSRLWFNCNPESPRHWFYLEWILDAKNKNALVIEFELKDNPSLTERTLKRYESMYHGVFYDRFIRGKWVIAEGLVYQFDSPDEYICKYEDAKGAWTDEKGNEHIGKGEYYLSIDYGITNPFACLLWRVTPDRAYIVDEYYFASSETGRRRTDAEHYKAVDRFAKGYPIEAIIIDPSASSFKEEIYRAGKYSVYDADNSVTEGIQVTDQMLHDGTIKISETCENTLNEIQLYRWDDKAAKDTVIKEYDHCIVGDTLIDTADGEIPIKELVGKTGMVWSYDGSNAVLRQFSNVRMTRDEAEIYEVETEDGRKLKCTGDHLIMTERGWIECQCLEASDRIISI